jgi:hypothetical protein
MAKTMSDLSFSSIIKQSFDRGLLCKCGHRRLDHRMLDEYSERDHEEFDEQYGDDPLVYCLCPCDRFKQATNLEYLEFKVNDSEAGTCP